MCAVRSVSGPAATRQVSNGSGLRSNRVHRPNHAPRFKEQFAAVTVPEQPWSLDNCSDVLDAWVPVDRGRLVLQPSTVIFGVCGARFCEVGTRNQASAHSGVVRTATTTSSPSQRMPLLTIRSLPVGGHR